MALNGKRVQHLLHPSQPFVALAARLHAEAGQWIVFGGFGQAKRIHDGVHDVAQLALAALGAMRGLEEASHGIGHARPGVRRWRGRFLLT